MVSKRHRRVALTDFGVVISDCVLGVLGTCTGRPHEGREHSVRPLVGGEVVVPVQLSQTHRLWVQRILLLARTG